MLKKVQQSTTCTTLNVSGGRARVVGCCWSRRIFPHPDNRRLDEWVSSERVKDLHDDEAPEVCDLLLSSDWAPLLFRSANTLFVAL